MKDKLKKIKIFLMDVDGVLTDGKMFYFTDSNGIEHEFKAFDSQDGIGLILLNKFEIITGIVTGRESESVYQRARLLRMRYVYQGFLTKIFAVNEILEKTGVDWDELCYMGDDLTDLPVLKRCGFSACPANAVDEVKKICDYVSPKQGGSGAVRDICDKILLAKGLKDKVMLGFEKGIWPKTPEYETVNVVYSQWIKSKKG